jgi:hypothetical protein
MLVLIAMTRKSHYFLLCDAGCSGTSLAWALAVGASQESAPLWIFNCMKINLTAVENSTGGLINFPLCVVVLSNTAERRLSELINDKCGSDNGRLG